MKLLSYKLSGDGNRFCTFYVRYIYLCAITVFDSSNYWKIRAYVVSYIKLSERK